MLAKIDVDLPEGDEQGPEGPERGPVVLHEEGKEAFAQIGVDRLGGDIARPLGRRHEPFDLLDSSIGRP